MADGERRKSVLTSEDVGAIKGAFKEEISTLFETIGYDTSTPESRREIHEDHTFVRYLRKRKNAFIGAAVVAAGTAIGGAAGGGELVLKLLGGS